MVDEVGLQERSQGAEIPDGTVGYGAFWVGPKVIFDPKFEARWRMVPGVWEQEMGLRLFQLRQINAVQLASTWVEAGFS